MAEPTPTPEDRPADKPTPMTDWMAVWAQEDAREAAAAKGAEQAEKSESDTPVLTHEQVWGAPPEGVPVDVQPVALLPGDSPATPRPPAKDQLDPGLDGEIRQLLERTARYVKRPEVSEPESVGTTPGGAKPFLDFETPPGAWSEMAPTPLAFDEAANYKDETAGRLGLLDPVERPWQDPPTPHGTSRKRSSNPPLAPFDPPSMTSPLPDPAATRKKPSGPPRAGGESVVAPVPWTDAPPLEKAAGERKTTRRMRDTARRVRAALAPIAAEPAAPWLTLGTVAVSAAWFAVAFAAHNAVFAAVGAAFLAPFAIAALAEVGRRGQRP